MELRNYRVPAVEGACRLLSYIGECREPVPFALLPAATDLSRTTARRVLASLVESGFVEQTTPGRFRLGHSVRKLGDLAQEQLGLRKAARNALIWLINEISETAHVGVPHGGKVELVDVADSPEPAQVAFRPGALVDAHCSATGKILLAALPDFAAAFRSVHRGTYKSRTAHTMTSWSQLSKELEQVRKQDFAIDDLEYRDGVRCVAVPVIDVASRTIAAIGITAPVKRLPKRRVQAVVRTLRAASARMTALLGQARPAAQIVGE